MLKSSRFALHDAYRVLKNGLAIWGVLSLLYSAFSGTVILMSPDDGSWCRGNTILSAEALKVINGRPNRVGVDVQGGDLGPTC